MKGIFIFIICFLFFSSAYGFVNADLEELDVSVEVIDVDRGVSVDSKEIGRISRESLNEMMSYKFNKLSFVLSIVVIVFLIILIILFNKKNIEKN